MKKTVLVLTIALFGSMANAKLNDSCARDIETVAEGYLKVKTASIELGSEETRNFLLGTWANTAKSVALTCVGIGQIEIEKSLAGRMGLISKKQAAWKAAKTYEESINYFNSLINK